MSNKTSVTPLRNAEALTNLAANWFHSKWGIPSSAYEESIRQCQKEAHGIPQWYVIVEKNKIIAGLGVIENDFHSRKDLSPNICAVFVEEEYRGRGLAKHLLDFTCSDLAEMGIRDVFMLTEHTSFYEKCGWDFVGMVEDNERKDARVYHRHTTP